MVDALKNSEYAEEILNVKCFVFSYEFGGSPGQRKNSKLRCTLNHGIFFRILTASQSPVGAPCRIERASYTIWKGHPGYDIDCRCRIFFCLINPRPFSLFWHLRQWKGRGGGATPHEFLQTKCRRALKKTANCSSRVLAIGNAFFNPGPIFYPVMRGQRSNFSEIGNFSNSHAHISKTVNRSGVKLSPACCPFNCELDRILL